MKKLVNRILAVVALAMAATTGWSYDFTQGGLYYKILSSSGKTCEVTQRPSGSEGECGAEVTIPGTVTNEGDTYTVTVIGTGAFDNCTVSKLTIPTSVIKLEEDALAVNGYISRIYVYAPTPPVASEYAFTKATISQAKVYVPKGSLTKYQDASVWGRLKLIEFAPYEVTTNGMTFKLNYPGSHSCAITELSTRKTRVFIPSAVPINGELCAVTSFSLVNMNVSAHLVVLPNSIAEIEDLSNIVNSSEKQYWVMNNIVLPKNLKEIGTIFENSYPIEQIFMQATTPPRVTCDDAYEMGISCSTILNVPKGTLDAYKNAPGWKNFVRIREKGYLEPADETFTVGNLTFTVFSEDDRTCELSGYDNANGTGVVDVPSYVQHNGKTYKVIYIGKRVFREATLAMITLPPTLRCIASQAFYKAQMPNATIAIPDSVTAVGSEAFSNASVETVKLGKSLNRIGYDAFVTHIRSFFYNRLDRLTSVYTANPIPPRMDNESGYPSIKSSNYYSQDPDKVTLYVPKGALETYKNDKMWGKAFTVIKEYDFDADTAQ